VNAIVAAILSIVITGIIFTAILYTIYSNWIAAQAQNVTTTPIKTGINATTILNAVNNHLKLQNATVTNERQ
jgi:hypothetical protein